MKEKYAVVMTTCGSLEEAQTIIDALLADKLAACIQTMPINSHYYWNGVINKDSEILMYIKTKKNYLKKLKVLF